MICLRPSELYFILHHLSLRDLHSSSSSLIPPSSSQSKEVSDASQYIVTSDLIHKLRNSVNTYHMSRQDTLSSISTTTNNNMTADILSKYPSIIQSTSLYDRIQSSSSTTNSSSPSSHLIEHTIDRDVSFIFYLTPQHHHHDYSSHFLNDSVTIMSHQNDNDDYSNDVHKGTKNEYVSFSKFNPSEVIPSLSSSSYSTTTIIFDEHQKQQEQQQHQDPPYYINFNDYTNNNNNYVMIINNINALANIKWLITASRTVLTSLYSIDKSNIYSSITNNHNTIHELQDLNTKLIKHKKDIFLIFQDIYKIQLCYNICMNYNSQLRLLINHYKKESDSSSRSSSDSSDNHRKVNEDNNNADDDVVINLQNEYLHYDGVYLHWNPRNSDNNISSTSSSTTTNKIDNNARVNGSTNNNDDNYHNNISLDEDLCVYDIDKSLSRLILLQNQLESQLYHHHHHPNYINNSNYNVNYHDYNRTQLSSNETKSNQSNSNHDDNNATNNNKYISSKLALLVNKTALFTSQQQQQPHHHQQDDHFHQLKHQQHSNSSDVVNIDSSIRTPNPLHAVMQSVFSSSSSSSLFT